MNTFSRLMLPVCLGAAFLLALLITGCPVSSSLNVANGTNPTRSQRWLPEDKIYDPTIHTPQLYRPPYQASYPVLFKGAVEPLVLEFDQWLPEDKPFDDYYVDIVNCDRFWRPTTLLPIEFYDGFTQVRIENYERSRFTKVPYMHYVHAFPRENEGFKMSGNYILKVYRNANPSDVVLTRRFIVVEREATIETKYELSSRLVREKMADLAFEVVVPGVQVFNPAQDLTVKVMQNFRWDSEVVMGAPRFYTPPRFEYYIDFMDAFQGGNEFRYHANASTQLLFESVEDIEDRQDAWHFFLFKDDPLTRNVFRSYGDRNGTFSVQVEEWDDPRVQADYVLNQFRVRSNAPVDGNVYVFGKFSDWQMLPQYQLEWNEALGVYERDIWLKQGIYDYEYVVKRSGDPLPDEATFQGRHEFSENFYTVLVYHRRPTDRTDRLIGYQPFNYQD
ncbi:type IX secretion system plug protein domain-containing protein [Pontibacter sp. G13]|uniref:type IX secretion system plug protein n=1 Tax=Pontibacter sp. G13 TaxID=3074898 RepID=UPI00288A7936|nr:type IX secretion system plug protein domain-containing protein [Pontibacter sp. G13]WNJ20237.1 DUF5103 domain-containing protein [Pontibacter sp. G13]